MDTKRFNNPEYKKQIRAVRNYRRQVQPTPNDNKEKILYFLGLNRRRNQIFTVIAIALLIYLTYFAGFLMIRDIDVNGADSETASEINQNFQAYKKQFKGYLLPQKNILFFSKAGFKDYLLKNNYKVATVDQIKARLWNHVSIKVQQRTSKYILQTADAAYVLNSDSTIGAQIQTDQPFDHPVMVDTADESVNSGEKFFDEQKNRFLQTISDSIETKLMLPIAGYEVPGRASDQLIVKMQKGFKVYFSTNTDPEEYFQRLYALWLQLNPDQQNRLSYFDLRFDKNAYGCFKNDPCANN
jgi:cell division septal protein FtsQ